MRRTAASALITACGWGRAGGAGRTAGARVFDRGCGFRRQSGAKNSGRILHLELMLSKVLQRGEIGLCGTCMDARGLRDEEAIKGCQRSTMAQLAQWTAQADKVLVF